MSSTSMPNPAVTRPTLRRDADRRLLLGVCAGIARVLDTDPVIVRAAWIVIGLFTGPLALIAYVAAAIIVPRDDGRMLLGGEPPDRRETRLGWAGVVVASILLLASAPNFHGFWIDQPFSSPLLIVALIGGVIVLARANAERSRDEKAAAPATMSAPAQTPADVPGAPDAPGAVSASVTEVTEVVPGRVMGSGSAAPPTIEYDVTPPQDPPPPFKAPRGSSIFLRVAGAIVAGAAIAVVLDASGAIDLRATGVAILLGVGALGAGVTAAVAAGRRGTGPTLALGIVLALAAAGVAAIGPQLDDGVGYRSYRPATAADIQPEYRLGLGYLELDLGDTVLPAGTTTSVKTDLGAGQIELRVPDDVQVQAIGDTSIGGRLKPLTTTRGVAAPVIRIDGHTDVGGPLQVVRDGS
jgi:phage shock protein PspC (stress-responsive transcriptional regulator)